MDNASARKLLSTLSAVPEQLDPYKRQTEAFRAKFGRDMGPDDPFFFDPDTDYPQFRSAEHADVAIEFLAEVMARAGLDPALVFAFKRTGGLFPTLPNLTEDEMAEWNSALNEFYWSLRASGVQ
jgi:hypothetical protein